jgi:hypothetical protein
MEKTDGVETFVGIDAHSRQCSIKAITRQGEALFLNLRLSIAQRQNFLPHQLKKRPVNLRSQP